MAPTRRISVRRQAEVTHAGWRTEARRREELRAARVKARGNQRRARTSRRSQHLQTDEQEAPRWTSYQRLLELNQTMAFEPLSVVDKVRLEREAMDLNNDTVLDRRVCAVTDTWVFPKFCSRIPVSDLPFEAMRAVLTGHPWCTPHIAQQYDCSPIDSRLEGLLLSPRAFEPDENNVLCVWITTTVMRHLHAVATRLRHSAAAAPDVKPPKFAIADGFVGGTYAAIDEANTIELQAVALAQIRGVVKVVYGGPGNVLHSHLLCWDNRDATIASDVPSVIRRENFQLILAGPLTSPQEILLAKRHTCNGDRVFQVHELLRRINPLYAAIKTNVDFTVQCAHMDDITTRLDTSDDTELLIQQARARQSTVARMHDDQDVSNECTIVETQTVLMETAADQTEEDRLERAYSNVTGSYVAKRSTQLLKSNDPLFMERLFPHLLTFGIGGFTAPRHHRYSHRTIVLHYLNVSTNRFAEDPMFKLAMFDYLSTMRVKTSAFLRIGQDPALATTAMKVTPSALKTAMRNRSDQRKAWKQGRLFVPAVESSLASHLLKSINATASKMWGSNEEREALTRKVDAMTILYGAPSVFWTLTPNPDCSIACAFWTGRPLPNGRPNRLSECLEANMPCSTEMAQRVMSNTVVQATYYRVCCHLLIDILFGWDTTVNKPKSRRGIFGYMEGLVYAMEQQGRLFVHHHGVAWVAGLPKTQSDWETLLQDPVLKSRFQEYCASIFSEELPIFDTVRDLVCPVPTCGGVLAAVPIPKKYKHLLKRTVQPPVVAKCSGCGGEFGEQEIVSAEIDRQWNALDDVHKALSSPSAVEAIRHRMGGLSTHEATSAVQLSRLLLKDQNHSFTHAQSCIKGRSTTKCRYRFFREIEGATAFNNKQEVVYRRRVGNQWLNRYIPLWRRIFHFNMDSRILWSGQSLQATRYALQYTVKQQTVLDNVAVVEMAFKKRVDRESILESSPYAKGVGRLLSLAYATSGVMEVGGPLATAIMMEGEAVTFSCKFERLVLLEGLSLLANTEVEALVIARDHQLFTETSITKYMERPQCLEPYCWYDFCCWFHPVGLATQHRSRCNMSLPIDSFSNDFHQHLKNHGIKCSQYPRVPDIIGPRLPDITRLGNDDYCEKAELFYRMVILLFHPFRRLDTMLDSSNSAKPFYDAWNPLAIAKIARAVERHQQYYIGLAMAQQYREEQRHDADENDDDEELDLDEDIQHQALEWTPGQTRVASDYASVPADLYCAESPMDVDPDMNNTSTNENISCSQPDQASTVISQLLLHSITSSVLPPERTNNYTASATPITRAQISQAAAAQAQEIRTDPATTPNEATVRDGSTAILVEALEEAIREGTYDATSREPTLIRARASIRDVSTHFHLNSAQHIAFTLLAVPILSKIAGVSIPHEKSELFNMDPLIITGAGGTGKSQVISAVRALVTAWGHPDSIMVVASTGIAAASLQGTTMHSSVGLGINATRLPKHISAPTDALLRQWAPILCVIADEVSMVDLAFFGLWEEAVRYAKEQLDQPFGGLVTVLLFDHCQLRTVRGTPMFKTARESASLTPAQDRGRRLYQAITKVVYFTENMRFSQDSEWGEWLSNARLGNWKPALRHFVDNLDDFDALKPPPYHGLIQTISTDNATRSTINDTAIQIATRSLGPDRKMYVVPARLSRRISPIEMTVLRGLPDNKTGNIPLFQHLYIGMPVRIKSNQCVAQGVANGASGVVYHIDWPRDATFSLQPNGAYLSSTQPTNVYVDINNNPSTARLSLLPSEWPMSVMPVCQVTASVTIKGPSLSIKGYPIVPAFGTTVHGVQGETKDAVAITNLRPPNVPTVDPHALYVALSRIRTRSGLFWVGPRPSANDYEFFRPSTEVLLEDTRLKRLSNATVTKFHTLLLPDNTME